MLFVGDEYDQPTPGSSMRPITVFLCGDVMTGRGIDQILPHPSAPVLYESYVHDARDYVTLAEARNGPIPRRVDVGYVWGSALDELACAKPDARIVNLETAITTSDEALPWKGIHYRMHPQNVGCLEAARIDVCVLANNHVLDWGTEGLVETIEVLERTKIRFTGAGRTIEEAERPAIVPVEDGGRVLVLGLGHPSSGIPLSWNAAVTRPGVRLVTELAETTAEVIGDLVARIKRPGDVVIASIHWGSNWGYRVPDRHVRFAHALAERGVDVVHGHSSHHARPIEIYDEKLILYGVGDFLSDYEGISGYEEYRGDLPLMYFATLDRASGRLVGLRMVPMRMRRLRLERAAADEVTWLADTLAPLCRPYGADVIPTPDGALELVPAQPPAQAPA